MLKKEPFGNTGMELTRIGFGGIPIMRVSVEKAVDVVLKALDMGINWIDTAAAYTGSELRIGKALAKAGRDKAYVFTKSGADNPELLKQQIDKSLTDLQSDYVDMFQFHCLSRERWAKLKENGGLEMVMDYHKNDKIKHIAASFHEFESAIELVDQQMIEAVQWPFNYIENDRALQVLEKCRELNKGFIAMKPFGGGLLENADICIRYVLSQPNVFADPGFETSEEIREVITAALSGKAIDQQDMEFIKKMTERLGADFCRRCGYCMPCPNDLSIPPLMGIESIAKRSSPEAMRSEWIRNTINTSYQCDLCGQCEEKCPYNLPIREKIKFAQKYYEDNFANG